MSNLAVSLELSTSLFSFLFSSSPQHLASLQPITILALINSVLLSTSNTVLVTVIVVINVGFVDLDQINMSQLKLRAGHDSRPVDRCVPKPRDIYKDKKYKYI